MKSFSLKDFVEEFGVILIIYYCFGCFLYFGIMLIGMQPWTLKFFGGVLRSIPSVFPSLLYAVLLYLIVCKQYLRSHRRLRPIVHFLVLTSVYVAINIVFVNSISDSPVQLEKLGWLTAENVGKQFSVIMYAMAYSGIKVVLLERELKRNSEKEQLKATLIRLRSQVDPHFIFNSLNNLYGLAIEEKADKTAESLIELSSLFRYSLKESTAEKIPVQKELEFIDRYVKLNLLRIEERESNKIVVNLDYDHEPASIAPLLLINFVENAFKYGISSVKYSEININLKVENKKLTMVIKNTIHKNDKLRNGYGLVNAKKRLELLYKNNYSLVEKKDAIYHETSLTINLI